MAALVAQALLPVLAGVANNTPAQPRVAVLLQSLYGIAGGRYVNVRAKNHIRKITSAECTINCSKP